MFPKVASQVIESHFLPDLRGNLVAFTRQKVRCVRYGQSSTGECHWQADVFSERGTKEGCLMADDSSSMCGGNIVLTVSEGSVRKYIKVTQHVMENYGVDLYTRQTV